MVALLAISWQPELRGILITIIAVTTFCGSCYFLLSTNLGARLGFLVALAALATAPKAQKKDYGDTLAEALKSQRSVKIRYKGSWRTIDPYSLNTTYVVAYCHFARDIRTFRIDRIQGAELSEGFILDKSLQATAQPKLTQAPAYKYTRRRRG